MKILEDARYRKAYKLVVSDVKCYLCRILNEYDNIEEAKKDLSSLLADNKTEKVDLSKDEKKAVRKMIETLEQEIKGRK
ncbi:MAG: hypothetical protein PHV12_04860 [Bacteroidales bacterium]|nr:hypothetical protein [Bacteroidales bacterium]